MNHQHHHANGQNNPANDDALHSREVRNHEVFQESQIYDCQFRSCPVADPDEIVSSTEDIIVPCCCLSQEETVFANYAYEMERPLRDDRNGVEFFEGRVLERHTPPTSSPNELFFIRTCTKVTIKVMSNHRISEGSKQVAAMQYLQSHVSQDEENREAGVQQMIARVENVLKSHHIIPCVEALYDSGESEDELYIIMPFFEDTKYLLTEPEARNCLKQILKGVETLQEAGVCSRNLRLENIVVRDDTFAIVMDSTDSAFAIKIPYIINENGIRQRCRIKADRACGKHYYMSPEIWENVEPFDGHAVDVWALGPILFMMVCGMPPWHTAAFFDENFRYFSAGHFEQLAIERFEISAELSNLLQGMFWLNPEDRLSLGQIRDHPWMALPNENMR